MRTLRALAFVAALAWWDAAAVAALGFALFGLLLAWSSGWI